MFKNLLEIPLQAAKDFPNRISHKIPTKTGLVQKTYEDFKHTLHALTCAFTNAGIKANDHVGFFVNNCYEWLATDFALMAIGAVSVPRGSDTSAKEVEFIFKHSDSQHLIVENALQLESLLTVFDENDWSVCKTIFLVEKPSDVATFLQNPNLQNLKHKIHFYEDFLSNKEITVGKENILIDAANRITKVDLLTIVYTSGTTGNPKGVMLTQGNFLQNVSANTPRLGIKKEAFERTVVMLPSWHVYERAFEYCAISMGVSILYSHAGRFAQDLVQEKPTVLISVPRVWESIYSKLIRALSEMPFFKRTLIFLFIKINQAWYSSSHRIQHCYISLKKRNPIQKAISWTFHLKRYILLFPLHALAEKLFKPFQEKVGGKLRLATCGAGSLPKYLDEIFNAIGIHLVNAYGMTECAPGILSRTLDHNTFGATGIAFDNTLVELRKDDGTIASIGEKGVIFVKGPQVMQGYYKNLEATKAVLSDDGWLNTGDLAVQSEDGEYIIVGRLKDTIVLMGGENVEPEPIEEKLKESKYIDHAVVVGQDQKQLSVVIAINEDELMRLASELKLDNTEIATSGKTSIENDLVYKILQKEVNSLISKEQGFKSFEFINKIIAVKNDFSIGKELTQTLKVKRKFIEERYAELIKRLFKKDK